MSAAAALPFSPLLTGLQFAHFIPECIATAATQIGLKAATVVNVPMTAEALMKYGANEASILVTHPTDEAAIDALKSLVGHLPLPASIGIAGVSLIATLRRELSRTTDG